MQFAPAHAKNRLPKTVPILDTTDLIYQNIMETDIIRITVLTITDNAFFFIKSLPDLL